MDLVYFEYARNALKYGLLNLGLKSGDRILFEEEGDKIVLKRFTTVDVLHLRYLENLLSPEWNSEEDNKAFNDL